MATAEAETLKQELPPIGGYRPLQFQRTFAKRIITFPRFFCISMASTAVWYYFFNLNRKLVFTMQMEQKSANSSIEPALLAERDREYLKQLKRNRDEEADLMKNYPGWVVGTYFGKPLFRNLPEDFLVEPDVNEYYIHTRFKYFSEYFHLTQRY